MSRFLAQVCKQLARLSLDDVSRDVPLLFLLLSVVECLLDPEKFKETREIFNEIQWNFFLPQNQLRKLQHPCIHESFSRAGVYQLEADKEWDLWLQKVQASLEAETASLLLLFFHVVNFLFSLSSMLTRCFPWPLQADQHV